MTSDKRCDPIRRGGGLSPRVVLLLVAATVFFTVGLLSTNAQAQDYFTLGVPWESFPLNDSWGVAVGDVDMDGDLDAVFANSGGRNTLYLNIGLLERAVRRGVLDTIPVWESSADTVFNSHATALGDVDGDGDLDVVFGNFGGPNTLYLNQGGIFGAAPVWKSDTLRALQHGQTESVVLADVNRDGRLDLVCGNGAPHGNTVYLNVGGVFETTPSWESVPKNDTRGIAVGDIDGDGWLDLACGNLDVAASGDSNTVYLNTGTGVLDTLPAWVSLSANPTSGVALGDINGDGLLDLACANGGENVLDSNSVYYNLGSILQTQPGWQSNASLKTTSVAVGDVDHDGDLDLLFGSFIPQNRLYVNDGAGLLLGGRWISSRNYRTRAVALADMDGDGDVDLVCANRKLPVLQHPNTVYDNVSDMFGTTPDWPGLSLRTQDVALGDVNGDGRLDLVCANIRGQDPNTLYLNNGGIFDNDTTWSAGISGLFVALGDVDGDGDLDVAFGNNSGANITLYENTENIGNVRVFGDIVWSHPGPNHKQVAWGDVDGDGDIDLFVGVSGTNASPGFSAIYLNPGTGVVELDTIPAWRNQFPSNLLFVALGDVDGDGRLDAVFSSSTEIALYVNSGTLLETTPRWTLPPGHPGGSVALADIDGDGRLDLIVGVNLDRNRIYFNNGSGQFLDMPGWFSDPNQIGSTTKMAVGDGDGDGDLDLLFGSQSEGTLYLNHGGRPSTVVDWVSPTQTPFGVALGDVDEDGDLDAVFGNAGGGNPNTLFFGQKQPAFAGDPAMPRSHLPNNGAYLRTVRTQQPATNLIRITFSAFDVESDPVWIIAEYQFEGAQAGAVPVWSPVEVVGGTGPIGPLETSPAGLPHTFDWDITRVPIDPRNMVLRLRTISTPKQVSTIQHVALYLKPLGVLEPVRSEISTSLDTLAFSTITVGDTACVDLLIVNRGNAPLDIFDIQLPALGMSTSTAVPFAVLPGDTATVTVCLGPCAVPGVLGNVQIVCNDPVRPVVPLVVRAEVLALEVQSELLGLANPLPLGRPVTLTVTPALRVRVEGGDLFFRPIGAAVFDQSVPLVLSTSGSRFIAVIPGASVTELGLEYYIRVVNSCAVTTDPPGAPGSFFTQAVGAPVQVTTSPIPTEESVFLEGQSIRVEIGLATGAILSSGTLHYRRGGASVYENTPIQVPQDDVPFGTVPDSLVGPRGVEYWVEVVTGGQTILTDPPMDPAGSPRSIRVLVPDLVEPGPHAGGQYRLLSVPLAMGGTITGSLTDDIGGPDNTRWRMFAHEPAVGSPYSELPNDSLFAFEQGRAYWLATRDAYQIGTGPDRGETPPTDQDFELTLEPGFNLIGNPFNFSVAWDSMRVDTLSMAQAESTLVEPPVGFVAGYQFDVPVLEPFDGYWVKNLASVAVTLRVPAKEFAGAPVPSPPVTTVAPDDGWTLGIRASSGSARDTYNRVGVKAGATNQRDPNDRSEVPMSPGSSVALYFPHEDWTHHPGRYTVDIRGEAVALDTRALGLNLTGQKLWGYVWHFDVAKNFAIEGAGDEVVLEMAGVEDVPGVVYLVDRKLETAVDLRSDTRYTFFQGERGVIDSEADARFTLVVGSEEFAGTALPALPTRTILHPNYPNPFNPTTIIRYEIAQAGAVTLRIYDATGALVKDVYRGQRVPGVYEVGWNGENNQGHTVASGIYFYRLRAVNFTQTRKMVLLK